MGFPPSSIKGQNGSKLNAKWNLQVPLNQATDLGGIDALIETGNENVIANPGFEANNVTGWAVYADAAGTSPVDGTGGVANVTFAATATTPLVGTYSALLTKDAANRQGEGASYDFTINRKDRNQLLDITFDYEIASGTYASGDVGVFIYDVTNAALINPIIIDLPGLSGTGGRFQTQFQATSSTSYRLILHVRTTSASAYTIEVDNFAVKPSQSYVGTIVTNPVSYTPTGSFNTNVTYSGRWWRNGKFMEGYVKMSFSGAPNAVVSTFTIPTGYTIDTSELLTASTANAFILGQGVAYDSSAGDRELLALEYDTTTTLRVKAMRTVSIGNVVDANGGFSQATPFTIASGDSADLYFKVPISGWSATNSATGAIGVIPVATYLRNTNQSISNTTFTTLIASTQYIDTTSSYNSSTGVYTVSEAGVYKIEATIRWANTPGAQSILRFTRNGGFTNVPQPSDRSYDGSNAHLNMNGFVIVQCAKGDTLEAQVYQSSGGALNVTGSVFVSRIDKNLFGANQLVAAIYTTNAGQSVTNSFQTATYEDIERDTHGAYNTGTGTFTTPMDGLYTITATQTISSNLSTSQGLQPRILRNGGTLFQYFMIGNGVTSTKTVTLTTYVFLNAGDTIVIQKYSDVAGTFTASASDNRLSIVRVS